MTRGLRGQSNTSQEPDRALIEHWDGSTWAAVTAPALGSLSGLLYSVSGTNDNDLLIAGESQSDITGSRTLVETHAGGSWAVKNSPSVGMDDNHLYSLTNPGGGAAWAAGSHFDPTGGHFLTLIERRDASGWVQEPSPSPGQANGDSQVGGVIAISSTDVWAVGDYDGPNALQSLILHRCQ
jgi:hypothetical protein